MPGCRVAWDERERARRNKTRPQKAGRKIETLANDASMMRGALFSAIGTTPWHFSLFTVAGRPFSAFFHWRALAQPLICAPSKNWITSVHYKFRWVPIVGSVCGQRERESGGGADERERKKKRVTGWRERTFTRLLGDKRNPKSLSEPAMSWFAA